MFAVKQGPKFFYCRVLNTFVNVEIPLSPLRAILGQLGKVSPWASLVDYRSQFFLGMEQAQLCRRLRLSLPMALSV